MNLRMIAAIAAAGLIGCADDPTAPSLNEMVTAPVQIRVSGIDLVLETYLYRDFAPVSPVDGREMIASVRLKTANGEPLPSGLRAETFHVVNVEEVWTPALVQEWPSDSPSEMELVARDGPKWATGSRVDVVLELRHGDTTLLLRAPAQEIHRTD